MVLAGTLSSICWRVETKNKIAKMKMKAMEMDRRRAFIEGINNMR
jgi:hypothetical protein